MGEGMGARFKRLYCHNGNNRLVEWKDMPEGYPEANMPNPDDRLYHLESTDLLDEYVDRLLIEWPATQTLAEYADSVRPRVMSIAYPDPEPFPGYDDLTLDREQLEAIVDEPVRYRPWTKALRDVQAVYLITCMSDGAQYVGSATGTYNLLQRWTDYRKTGHAGNTGLIRHLDKHPGHLATFRYSILRIFSPKTDSNLVLDEEARLKKKLGTIQFGMNDN